MLPPRELHTRCLRCGADREPDARTCRACGADHEVELAVAAELNPAVASLRRWLLALGGLALLMGGLLYEHNRALLPAHQLKLLVIPQLAYGCVLLAQAALARTLPLTIAVMALALFLVNWALVAFTDPLGAFAPSPALALRIVFAFILAAGVRAGYRAHSIRRRARIG